MTGTVLTLLWPNPFLVAAMATFVGSFAGFGITKFLHIADTGVGGRVTTENDFRGVTAKVVLPVASARLGRVRFKMKGRTVEMMASTEESATLQPGTECLVIAVEEGVAQVVALESTTTRG